MLCRAVQMNTEPIIVQGVYGPMFVRAHNNQRTNYTTKNQPTHGAPRNHPTRVTAQNQRAAGCTGGETWRADGKARNHRPTYNIVQNQRADGTARNRLTYCYIAEGPAEIKRPTSTPQGNKRPTAMCRIMVKKTIYVYRRADYRHEVKQNHQDQACRLKRSPASTDLSSYTILDNYMPVTKTTTATRNVQESSTKAITRSTRISHLIKDHVDLNYILVTFIMCFFH